MPERPTRVAIIGGGCAALTTAFELTQPALGGKYDVTVYQMGWRLGGKGASGRGPHDRIEEHGLHLWMGFYENAFRLMRECYAERAEDGVARRFNDWREAFTPANDVAVVDRNSQGAWESWVAQFPIGRGLPGDLLEEGSPFTVANYLRQSTSLLVALFKSAREPGGSSLAGLGQLAAFGGLFEAVETLRTMFAMFTPEPLRAATDVQLRLIESIAAVARRQIDTLLDGDVALLRLWQVADIILAILRGSTMHALAFDPRGFDAINDYDWREWLMTHGASRRSVDAGFMRGIYDLAFAFENGDVNRPSLAAGVALRGAMRMFFTYRGALFWRMSAGMGDVVFAPLYEVLKRRGVRFEFFHRLRNLRLSSPDEAGAPYVEALEIDVQARIKQGREYRPLVDVHGVASWPARPDYSQLVGGAALERQGRAFEAHWETRRAGAKSLRAGRDFDFVVLGVSVGAVPYVASELIERSAKWAEMVRHVKSVPTQAMQLWLRADAAQLGWPHPPINLSGFVEPFDTWADMSHLIPEESWAARDDVRSIAYFCSVMPDEAPPEGVTREFAREQRAAVRRNAIEFLERDVGALWPGSRKKSGGFNWSLLAGGRTIDSQYMTANVNPSDRYVLSLPGSLRYRISPLDLTFDNLTIAGDWTASGLDSGCIESAVMSGRLAAHALSQHPALEEIVGYNHP